MGYNSSRRLCALAQGFIEGAGDYFGEAISVEHRSCMNHGDAHCLMAIRSTAKSAQNAAA
jgi:predicted hydrocarbon binding protein